MIALIKVLHAQALDGHRLALTFSNGRSGVCDLSGLVAAEGLMVQPLRDKGFFSQVFVRNGVPTWPNGFEIDAIALHDDMAADGLLTLAPA
jgi:hypothetical protein